MRRMMKSVIVALALTVACQSTSASVIYRLKAYPGIPPGIPDRTSDQPGLTWIDSATRDNGGQLVTGNWNLRGDQGALRAGVWSSHNGVYGSPNFFVTSSEFDYDDLVFTVPDSFGGTIGVALNLRLRGSFSDQFDPNLFDRAFGSVRIEVAFRAAVFSGGTQFANGAATGPGSRSGILSSIGSGHDFDVNLKIPFNATTSKSTIKNGLRIKLTANSVGGDGAFGDGLASAFSDFSLSFATEGPVFDVPDGVTVDSVKGGISDNLWDGGGGAVPEPASLAIWAIAGPGLLVVARRRRQRRQCK